jgi:ribonuclease T1
VGSAGSGEYAGLAPATPTTDLPTVTVAELPAEAVDTLGLIEQGGPFPYSKDGVTFQNREGILPKQKNGFYQEYTVETPGSSDRGARRIVTGKDGARFYTDDHYDSFSEVVSG